uniref:Uncharacterized protein n=1 Tax=Panagrolaimus sp. ES5 TaxID=591445 RepID=A0AC34GL91_9BILA
MASNVPTVDVYLPSILYATAIPVVAKMTKDPSCIEVSVMDKKFIGRVRNIASFSMCRKRVLESLNIPLTKEGIKEMKAPPFGQSFQTLGQVKLSLMIGNAE